VEREWRTEPMRRSSITHTVGVNRGGCLKNPPMKGRVFRDTPSSGACVCGGGLRNHPGPDTMSDPAPQAAPPPPPRPASPHPWPGGPVNRPDPNAWRLPPPWGPAPLPPEPPWWAGEGTRTAARPGGRRGGGGRIHPGLAGGAAHCTQPRAWGRMPALFRPVPSLRLPRAANPFLVPSLSGAPGGPSSALDRGAIIVL